MRRQITTAASVEAAKPDPEKQIDIPDAKVGGLSLRVSSVGRKTWSLRYRTALGEQRRVTLGIYPALGLADAREHAWDTIRSITKGGDPATEKKAAKAAAATKQIATIGDLLDTYHEACELGRHKPNGLPKRKQTMIEERYFTERLIRPKFGKTTIGDLTRHNLQTFLDDPVTSLAPSTARHCRNILRQAYNFAIRRELTDKNPAMLVDIPQSRSRERVLTDHELRTVWAISSGARTVDGLTMAPLTGVAICLLMVTLQRRGEVAGMHLREIDAVAKTWTIPGERVKNRKTHIVPLSDLALELIRKAQELGARKSGYLFPSRNDPSKQMTPIAITMAMDRMKKLVGLENATIHDLRRTGATNLTGGRIKTPR